MAADSDGSDDSLTTVVTCEGDFHDPEFPAKFELILDKLRTLLCRGDNFAADQLYVRKLEPWNSVRVTLAIPRDAALRLRQLASEGSQQLRALGILSVQVEGDQVISLRIAGRFGQEPQEIVLRTGSQDVAGPSSQQSASEGIAIVSGLTRMLSGGSQSLPGPSTPTTPVVPAPTTVTAPPLSTSATDKVQFRSPNVVCPTDTQVPKVPAVVQTAGCTTAGGSVQRNYNGPFPFASMTHAAQAIHSRETQSQQQVQVQQGSAVTAVTTPSPSHPFTQPPPPYPSQPPATSGGVNVVKQTLNPNSPNVAKSSPLLVNLLQNDGAQVQKIVPPSPSSATSDQRTTKPLDTSSTVNNVTSAKTIDHQAVINNDMDGTVPVPVAASAAVATANSFTSPVVTPPVPVQQTAIKYPPQSHINAAMYNSSTQKSSSVVPQPQTQPHTNIIQSSQQQQQQLQHQQQQQQPSLMPTNSNATTSNVPVSVVGGVGVGVRTMAPRLPHQYMQQQQQKLTTQVPVPVPVRPVQQMQTNNAVGVAQIANQLRPVRPQQQQTVTRLPQPVSANVQFTPQQQQFPRQNFRGQLGQFVAQQQTFQQNFQQQHQQFPSPPPYPRQRMDAIRPPGFQDMSRFQQHQLPQQRLQTTTNAWPQQQTNQQFQQIDNSVTPVVPQQMPTLTGLSQMNNQNLQAAMHQQHLSSLNAVLDSSLSSITPSLTDLSKSDLDSLLPSLEGELDSTPDIPDIPESLTSTGKKRQFLINPLTGVLEPMPSDSSGSESETEEGKETNDIFHDFNSPLNDRSNSIYSDEDTCSTTISRKFDTTDQSDSEATVKSTNSDNSVKSHQRSKSNKSRDRNRDSPGLKKNNKDLPTEKIKLRLKLEKSEPVSPAYKVDISFINTQQPKRATQNVSSRPTVPASPSVPCSTTPQAGEELRVPPLHISLRGRNSVVINSEKKKKYTKSNADGSIADVKKSKKNVDGIKVKKSMSAKDLTVKSGSLLPSQLSKSESSLNSSSSGGTNSNNNNNNNSGNNNNSNNQKSTSLIKSNETMLPSTSTLEQKLTSTSASSTPVSVSASASGSGSGSGSGADVKITSDILKSDSTNKSIKSLKTNSDLDDLPLKVRMREPGEILSSSSMKSNKGGQTGGDMKKSKKSSKFNHVEVYREQNLLTGGHLVDDCKSHKKLKSDDNNKYQQHNTNMNATNATSANANTNTTSVSGKLNSHFKKDKFKEKSLKDRTLPGHVGEIRRGSDSDVAKCLKRHADSNGLSHIEKKRRLSQSEAKSNATTITESQGVNKSVKLKTSSASEEHMSAFSQSITTVQTVVGSTNIGTINTVVNKSLLKTTSTTTTSSTSATSAATVVATVSSGKLQKSVTKMKRDKVSLFSKSKDNSSFKSKDLNREKTYSQNVAEKLAKHLTLPTAGEIDMEAKFKQSLLDSSTNDIPARRQLDTSSSKKVVATVDASKTTTSDALQLDRDRVTDLVQNLSSPEQKATSGVVNSTLQDADADANIDQEQQHNEDNDNKCTVTPAVTVKQENSPDRKSTDTDLPPSQRLDDKQAGRSPNSGGQGEDSGIESMDALSEKSPNQASQSPHSHTDITITDPTTVTIKTIKSEVKRDNCLPDLMDIEEQLAKMDGLPTLNGDISHMIKTEPFMKTETLIEKLEGTEGKDLNENKEHVKEAILDECCGPVNEVVVQKVQTAPDILKTECKVELTELPLTVAMQENLKQTSTIKQEIKIEKDTNTNTNTTNTNANANANANSNSSSTSNSNNTNKDNKTHSDNDVCIVNHRKFNCSEQKSTDEECNNKKSTADNNSVKSEQQIKGETKELDFDPLPIRRKPPLYTYSNPEKQSRETDSPIPNLSDLESENSDSNSECSELKSKISQKAATVTRRRKQNLDNIQMNDAELDGCIDAIESGHYLSDLTGFKKNDIVKKTPKSLLEQLLIEIPSELPSQQISSTSPSVSEKSLNTSKSSIRTRSSSKLNSPDISESSKSEKSIKTPRHSPVILNKDSPANSPVLCKASPKGVKATLATLPTKRKRQESESSTQSNASLDDQGNMTRNKKARKCSENAVELIKACMGFDQNATGATTTTTTVATAAVTTAPTGKTIAIKEGNNSSSSSSSTSTSSNKKVSDKNNKLSSGLLRKSQTQSQLATEIESSDSDEPLIEVAGKVRNKHVATRNKLNSTKSNIPTPVKSVPVIGKVSGANANASAGAHGNASAAAAAATVTEEKAVCTRRSVRNNANAAAAAAGQPAAVNAVSSPIVTLKTRSKLQHQLATDKTVTSVAGAATVAAATETDANRRKTRSAVSDDVKRRRNSRDGK